MLIQEKSRFMVMVVELFLFHHYHQIDPKPYASGFNNNPFSASCQPRTANGWAHLTSANVTGCIINPFDGEYDP